MPDVNPQVSIGLPVYNGENYVGEAIQCILAQTYLDWELVISDNSSTDRTLQICTAFAKKDSRIRVFPNERNLGTAPNFNRTFQLSRGRFFRWMAHDDLCGPRYVEECLKGLQNHPEAVLAFTKFDYVDAAGTHSRKPHTLDLNLFGATPELRVRQLIDLEVKSSDIYWCLYGLMRREALETTRLMEVFNASDQVLIFELALRGKFIQVNEELFSRREHPGAASLSTRSARERARWNYADHRRKLIFPYFRLFKEHLVSIGNIDQPFSSSLRCSLSVMRRFGHHWKDLGNEIAYAGREALSGFASLGRTRSSSASRGCSQ